MLAAYVLYGIAGVAFLAGLFVDWRLPGLVVVPPFVVTTGSPTNSGLFILSIVVLVVGFLLSKTGRIIEARRTEEIDQTQEWTVDVGSDRR